MMKTGDLIWYCDEHNSLRNDFLGIYLSSRGTKWSDKHMFHKVIRCGGGIDEFILRIGGEGRIEVVQGWEE